MKSINIYTSYFANYKNIDPMYQCIAISNSKPAYAFIPHIKRLAPPWSIVKKYKAEPIPSAPFQSDYLRYIHINIGPEEIKDCLIQFESDNIVLMCYEKDANICHRTILADYIKEQIPELTVLGEI